MDDPDAPETEPGGVRLLPPRPPGAPPGTGAGEPPEDRRAARRAGRRLMLLGVLLHFTGAGLVLANLLAAQGLWRVLGLIGLGLILTFLTATVVTAAARRELARADGLVACSSLAFLVGILLIFLGMWGGTNPLKLHGAVGLACYFLALPLLRAGSRRFRSARPAEVPREDEEAL